MITQEHQRLEEEAKREKNWKRWGPYLSERQWGTVREDYSEDGDAWRYFTHDQARRRAYRWGEDGLLGITDRECRLCFGLALWNKKDPFLKERLFGLSNPEGNHGEDVKELYYYLDATPTYSYFKALYKYPQDRYPYEDLVQINQSRGRHDREYELEDTGIFDEDRYFDVYAEYAKASPNDILVMVRVVNRAAETAELDLIGQIWARNTWTWGCEHEGCWAKPRFLLEDKQTVRIEHESLGHFYWSADDGPDGNAPEMLFTENDTNNKVLFGVENKSPYTKCGFHRYVVDGEKEVINPKQAGTKAGALYHLEIPAGKEVTLKFRLCSEKGRPSLPFSLEFTKTFDLRKKEADDFYREIIPAKSTEQETLVQRQAYAGLLWTKQFYHYSIEDWLIGDPNMPKPPASRWHIRNADWMHIFNRDVISMPDKWEYPWYAAWDSAFHMVPFANIDASFSKKQLILFLREWYMHPNGQIPAYEYHFSDVNPPVHAWACWRVYKMTGARGKRDVKFLAECFHKLLINFTWWVNRKDTNGNNLFSGGFLGLDNIGVFDRSKPLPTGGELAQADGTAWMAFYCGTMLAIALELARFDPSYDGVASKFFEHFIAISDAMNTFGGNGLWDEEDGFYYDQITFEDSATTIPMKIRSMVGLLPLIAVEIIDREVIKNLEGFSKRMMWFLENRPDLSKQISICEAHGTSGQRLLAIPSRQRLERTLRYMLDENEFLSPYGIRSMSRYHAENPFIFESHGRRWEVGYLSGESDSGLFGGNSNWRGPVWFPVNFLIIESLQRYHHFYGDSFKIEYPTGSGNLLTLDEVSIDLSQRLTRLFLPESETGRRPCHGENRRYVEKTEWKDLVLFYEYFDGDNGRGLGASHQTGWTSLAAKLLRDLAMCRSSDG